MTTTTTKTVRNGVDTEQLFGTLDAIKADPSLARFQFRARNRWIDGAHNRTTIRDFYAANQEDTSRAEEFVIDAGEPAILLGTDTGPNPAEYLLHALAACLTTSLVYVAAARGVHLTEVESTLEGDMDVQGALGLSRRVPQRLRADPRLLPRRGRRAGGEAAGGRRARTAALGRLRHGHQRRPRHGGRGDCVTTTAQRLAASEQAAANRSPHRKRPMPPALNLITDPTRESTPISDFADAMSTLASGVVLVTGWVGDRPWGMTVTAFASVSAEPPTVLVSLGSETTSAGAIRATRRFGVSILAEEQLAVARLGSEPGAAKFLESFVDAGDGSSDSPVVAGALAHLDCELSEAVQIADHTILFGRVHAAHASRSGTPLLYHRRAYRTLGDRAAGRPPTERKLTCLSS